MTSESPLVLVVEDEQALSDVVCAALRSHGYRCTQAMSVRHAKVEVENHVPDLVIADLGLPDRDGVELIAAIRRWSALPIIVLSARSLEAEKVKALDAGADDYVTKPFGVGELLARVRVALRHAAKLGGETVAPFAYRDLQVDTLHRRVTVRGDEIHLTPIEYKLLTVLLRRAGQVVTHAELLREAWGPGKTEQNHYLRIYMAGLRRKLEDDPAQPIYIQTEVGVGYRLAAD